jgi:hypothetical protein
LWVEVGVPRTGRHNALDVEPLLIYQQRLSAFSPERWQIIFVWESPAFMVGRSQLSLLHRGTRSALILGLTVLGQISVAAESPDGQGMLPKADHGHQDGSTGALAPPGNPLWAIPIGSLTATVERPIFEPSRRRPPAKVPDKVPADETASLPPASNPTGPPLVLLGAVDNERKSIAIFREQTTKNIVRLKIGDSHSGWTLRRVNGREATFNRGRETSLLLIEIP